jgi:hypothetical protein
VKIIILEKETLAGIACGKSEPQAIPAICLNPRGTESVTVSFDMDVPRLWTTRGHTGEPCWDDRTYNQNQERRQAPERTLAGSGGQPLLILFYNRRRRLPSFQVMKQTTGKRPIAECLDRVLAYYNDIESCTSTPVAGRSGIFPRSRPGHVDYGNRRDGRSIGLSLRQRDRDVPATQETIVAQVTAIARLGYAECFFAGINNNPLMMYGSVKAAPVAVPQH